MKRYQCTITHMQRMRLVQSHNVEIHSQRGRHAKFQPCGWSVELSPIPDEGDALTRYIFRELLSQGAVFDHSASSENTEKIG
jgi:hypothetical protein